MKRLIFILVFFMFTGCSHLRPKLNYTQPKATEDVRLVFDTAPRAALPLNFRKNADLKVSASGAFGENGAKYIAALSPVVTVLDLRLESHGLINGRAVTWSSEHDWSNVGLSQEEALAREKRYLYEIHIGDKIEKTKIRSVETEESLIRSLKQNYVRLTLPEGVRPSDAQVDRFLEILRDLPHDSWIHFEDRSGRGRSTEFLAMYDMLKNAALADFDEILRRNALLSHDESLLVLPGSQDWEYPYKQDRMEFLKEFYNYAKARLNDGNLTWSQWIRK